MQDQRPDPNTLLACVQEDESHQARGKLKIFLGATVGVGKTYAMLAAAHEQRTEGVDVAVGWVQTHGRAETEALVRGLAVLPRCAVAYHGTIVDEFDLDAALAHHPSLILVDELAHTNAPGSRHTNRWQDVEELLAAGIHVYTTLNVQHVESLNDVVAQITGVVVHETVPDSLLERADEIEFVDLPPDDLLRRLQEGKVDVPEDAEHTRQHFFRKGNLIALRALALRCMADRVDKQMQVYRRDHAITDTWPTTERLLVCVSPSPLAARLVRAARRMAARLRAEWLVVYVETPAHLRLPVTDRQRVGQTLRLAEQLGAETVTLSGQHISEEILAYAHTRNVSKLVVGKPKHPRWRDVVFGSVVDELVRGSGEMEIYVISGEPGDVKSLASTVLQPTSSRAAYGWGTLSVALYTLLAWLWFPSLTETNLVMFYLLGIVVIAMRCGRGPALWAAVLSTAAFNFFFVPPYLTFHVADAQYLLTFTVMLLVALVISTLTMRLRQQADAARQRERRTAALYAMSRELASTQGTAHLLQVAVRHISEVFDSDVVILLPQADGALQAWGHGEEEAERGDNSHVRMKTFILEAREQDVAQWVYNHQQLAGLGTATLPSAGALYLPLTASRGTVGVLGVRPTQPQQLLAPEQMHLLETFANQTALALARAILAEEAQHTQVQIEAERLRNTLLSTVSHDLRTPLATIAGAASSLLEADPVLPPAARRELLQAICDETDRLNRLVSNVLEMTRLESGALRVAKEWQPLEEVVGAALTRLEAQLHNRPLSTHLPPDLPLVPLDSVLVEHVLINLLDNTLNYTPPESPIALSAWVTDGTVTVEVADQGPGIPPGEEQRLFDKLYRGQYAGVRRGFGLGLTICRGHNRSARRANLGREST